jgi:hypothetical protein
MMRWIFQGPMFQIGTERPPLCYNTGKRTMERLPQHRERSKRQAGWYVI